MLMVEMSVMVGMVMALSQVIKQLEIVPTKYIPLLNLVIGVALCLLYYQGGVKDAVFEGVIVGLTASGLFSSGKKIIQEREGVVK